MHQAVLKMLEKYQCASLEDYENALKEIIQEIALLGFWRSKFFEFGAFYGGTALRILYQLDRFSEDMDFSLLQKNPNFDLQKYESALQRELEAFGFEVTVEKKVKKIDTPIESAFIKANTLVHLLKINANLKTHKSHTLKIKLEVDTDPPGGFVTEAISHFQPIPFTILTFTLPTLLAGKIAAMLFRPYTLNTKGRDWYDFLWYISRNIPLNIEHLRQRIIQIEKWPSDKPLTLDDVNELLLNKIDSLDLAQAQADVMPFVKDQFFVESWTKSIFRDATRKIQITSLQGLTPLISES